MKITSKSYFTSLFIMIFFIVNRSEAMEQLGESNNVLQQRDLVDIELAEVEKVIKQSLKMKAEWRDYLKPMLKEFKTENYDILKKLRKGGTVKLNAQEDRSLNELMEGFWAKYLTVIGLFAVKREGLPIESKEADRYAYVFNRLFMSSMEEDYRLYLEIDRAIYLERKERKTEEK
jgi:hypothetical protein